VVSYYGPADLIDAYAHPPHPDPLRVRELEEAFIGGTPSQMPKEYAAASPVTYTTRPLPATLLIYGRRDHSVEAKYGARLGERLAANGTTVAYLEIPWAEHAFDEVFNGVSSQVALFYTERFLAWAVR
jgi:acetyl esterase/lipase